MNTTALLVDILIIGLQSFLWIACLCFSTFLDIKQAMHFIHNNSTLFLFALIVSSYTLGIVTDQLVAIVFSKFRSTREIEVYSRTKIIHFIGADVEIHKFLNNAYERLRIARGTLFNLPLITISTIIFLSQNSLAAIPNTCSAIVAISIIGIVLIWLSYMSWNKRNETYLNHITQAQERLKI